MATLVGTSGNDTLSGGTGDDSLSGLAGFDSLAGAAGNDTLDGGDDTDVLVGGAGNDTLRGGNGDDLLQGGTGDDSLDGGAGDDSLEGGSGADTLRGGGGADVFLLQAMGDAPWGTPGAPDVVLDFNRAEGDRLRLSDAYAGAADGSGANAGTFTGADGIARPLVWSGSTGRAAGSLGGLALPLQALGGLAAIQVFWVPSTAGGGWLVADLDRDGRVGNADLVVQMATAPDRQDFVAGTFLSLTGSTLLRAGTAANETLAGGTLSESFAGSAGSDRILGGAGAANALSYAALTGPVGVRFTGYAAGTTAKPGGTDSFADIHAVAGTAGDDTLDAAGVAGGGLYVLSLEGRAGADRLVGNGTTGVQAAYGSSPGATLIDLRAGTAQDGWGSTDTLVGIRRVSLTSGYGDTLFGSAGDDIVLSGRDGNRTIDGRAGFDEWRYAGTGAVTVQLAAPGAEGFAQKPGGFDRLTGVEAVQGGAGNDSLLGGSGDERLTGNAGNDTLDGGAGNDTVAYDGIAPGSDLPAHGATIDLTAGTATDPWDGTDVLRNVENAWGSALADDITGRAVAGLATWLRGLAGNDTLRAPATGTQVGADYAGDPAGITADLGTGTVADGWGGIDTLVRIALLRGSDYADRITGGAGPATLHGGAGDDTYLVGDAATVLVEAAAGGNDTVIASVSWTLAPEIETLVLAEGSAAASGAGNAANNRIVGNSAGNALNGGAGDDRLEGGDGNDVLAGGPGQDTLLGGTGNDTLFGEADSLFTGTLAFAAGDGAARSLALASAAVSADSLDSGAGVDVFGGSAASDLLDLRSAAGRVGGIEWFLMLGGDDAVLLDAAAAEACTLVGGDGNDTLVGNAAVNWLQGDDGNDLLAGMGGADTMVGLAGDDTIVSADWDAAVDGGSGNDLGVLDRSLATARVVLDAAGIGDGTGRTALAGLERLSVTGGSGDDSLAGGAGDDTLRGGAGHDWLGGGAGANALYGEAGDDTLASAAWDATVDGGAGTDLGVLDRGSATAALLLDATGLGDGTRRTALVALERLSVQGGAFDDTLAAGAGDDTLRGGDGRDSLSGGGGVNLLLGENGDDTLVSAAWDATLDGGAGTDLGVLDRGFASAALLLDATGIGDGTLRTALIGIEQLSVHGGAGDDTLAGGAGGDTLRGGAGQDRLDGGGGLNVLLGEGGNDTLVSGAAWDATLDGGTGTDLAILDRSWAVRGLTLATAGIGDGSAFTALAGIERLSVQGGGFDDTLAGGAGDDTLRGGAGQDRLDGGGGANALYGEAGDDTLLSAAWDTLLDGSIGADLAVIDRGGATRGIAADLARVSDGTSTTTLAAVERLSVQGGSFDDTLSGGAGDDTLRGGAGQDRLDGGTGANLLSGEGGDDTLLSSAWDATLDGGTGADLAVIDRGTAAGALAADLTRVTDGLSTTLLAGIERLDMTGGAGADALAGGAAADTLRGGDGSDTLRGNAGDDLLEGGAGTDIAVFSGNAAATTRTRQSDGSWILAGPDGTDTLRGVEVARFADADIPLTGGPDIPTGPTLRFTLDPGRNLVTGQLAGSGPGWVIAGSGDIDGDGRADLLWRQEGGGLALWQRDGAAWLGAPGEPGDVWRLAGLLDVNGDGQPDLVWGQEDGLRTVWLLDRMTVAGSGARLDWSIPGYSPPRPPDDPWLGSPS